MDALALMEAELETGKGLNQLGQMSLKDHAILFHNMLISGAREKGEKYSSDLQHSKLIFNEVFGEYIQEHVPDFLEVMLRTKEESSKKKQGKQSKEKAGV